MADNSKITLKQLKDAMNMVKAYIDEQIQGISPNPPEEGTTLSISNITGGEFTTSNTVTITYTTSKAVTKHEFVMNYLGADSGFTDGTARVISSGNNHTMRFNPGELSAGTKNGAIKVTDADGNTAIAQFTLVITEGSITPEPTPVLYELPQETVFNGSNICIETGIALFGDEYLNTDWTILFDFTDNGSSTQASIFDCEDGVSPFPGVCVKFYNGNVIASIYGKAVTLGSQDTNRHKFVMTKSGNTFTSYDENMSQLDVKTFDSLATVAQKLLLGCSENATGYRGPYMKGTIHRFKVVEGVMSREDCLAWMA